METALPVSMRRFPRCIQRSVSYGARIGSITQADADQHHIGRAAGKQAYRDYAGELVEVLFQRDRVGDLPAMHVDDPVAVIGSDAVAPYRLAPPPEALVTGQDTAHRDWCAWP